jgi:hypothetical protein
MLTTSIIGICILAFSTAFPQGYGNSNFNQQHQNQRPQNVPGKNAVKQLPAGCRLEYRVVHSIVEKEETQTKCTQKYRNVCIEKFQRICNPYQDKVCRQSYERKCNTLVRNNCYEAYRDVNEPWETEECRDETVKKCEEAWIDQGNAGKVWGDDGQTNCKYLKETKCRTITKTRTVKQAYEKCDKVPYQDCKDVPKQVCEFVTKERCSNEPYQDCNNVPYNDCQEVHKKVPHQISQRRPFKVCENLNDPYQLQQQDIVDYDLILEAREQDYNYDDDAEDFDEFETEQVNTGKLQSTDNTFKQTPVDSSAVTFG